MPMQGPPHPGEVIQERCAEPPVRLSNAFGGSIESWLTLRMRDDLARVSKKEDEIDVSR